jgi:HAD superfamily hydrolase (TIGR01549 family)
MGAEPPKEDPRLAIAAVILDAGGVLLHPDLDWISARAAELGISVTRTQLHRGFYRLIYRVDCELLADRQGMAVTTDEIRLMLMRGLLASAGGDQVETIAAQLARQAAIDFPREGDIFHWAMPGIRQRLLRLQAAGFAIGVASNNDGSLQSQLERVGIDDLLPVRLDSAVEGVAKPDPELLLRAARALGVDPPDCLYVGDLDRVDGAAARAAGMHFALLDPLAQPRPAKPRCIADLDQIHRDFRPRGF